VKPLARREDRASDGGNLRRSKPGKESAKRCNSPSPKYAILRSTEEVPPDIELPLGLCAEEDVFAMWIVRVALDRPYTFVVLALMILILSVVAISRTLTDIFPNIDIPVVAVDWTYTGLNSEELEGRLTSNYERILTTTVDNIQHLESITVNGQAIVKVFPQPGASLDTANASAPETA
jgi:AcrB/AcrD/AcrF family